jgi:hypothetical protein
MTTFSSPFLQSYSKGEKGGEGRVCGLSAGKAGVFLGLSSPAGGGRWGGPGPSSACRY